MCTLANLIMPNKPEGYPPYDTRNEPKDAKDEYDEFGDEKDDV
jgi:hypothetical protein